MLFLWNSLSAEGSFSWSTWFQMAGEISAEHWQEELFKHRWGLCFDFIRAVIKGQAGICLATMSVAAWPLLTERTMKLLRKLNESQIPHSWGLLCQPSFAMILFVGLAGANALVGSESNSDNRPSLHYTFIGSQKNLLAIKSIKFPTYWSYPATGNLSDSPGQLISLESVCAKVFV